jgi:hypothetical protein
MREFRGVIVDACLHRYAYEPARRTCTIWLVGCLPDKDSYYTRVLESLKESGVAEPAMPEPGDLWRASNVGSFAGYRVANPSLAIKN